MQNSEFFECISIDLNKSILRRAQLCTAVPAVRLIRCRRHSKFRLVIQLVDRRAYRLRATVCQASNRSNKSSASDHP